MNKRAIFLVFFGISLLVPQQFVVPAQVLPELEVTILSVTPANPMDGEIMTITATIENIGPIPAVDVIVRFLVNGTKLGVGGNVPDLRVVGDVDVGLLDPGSSKTVSVDTIARFGDISVVVSPIDLPGEGEYYLGIPDPPFDSYTDADSDVTVEATGESKKYVTDPVADVLLINPPFERWLLLKVPLTNIKIAIGPSHGSVDTMYGYSDTHGVGTSTSVTIESTVSFAKKFSFLVGEAEIKAALSKAYTQEGRKFSETTVGHTFSIRGDETSEEDIVGWHQEEYMVYTYNVYLGNTWQGKIVVAEHNQMNYGQSPVSEYNRINGDHPDIAGYGYEQNHEVGCVKSYDGTSENVHKVFGNPVRIPNTYWRDPSTKYNVTAGGSVEWSYKVTNGWANSQIKTLGVSLTLQVEIGGYKVEAAISISQSTTHTVYGSSTSEFGGHAPPVDLTWGDYRYTYFPWIWWTSFGGAGSDEYFLTVDYHVTWLGSGYNQPPSLYNIPLNGGNVTGTVVDTQGEPVEGVEVTFENPTFYETAVTDANGDYTLLDVPAGAYNVHYSPIVWQHCNIPWQWPRPQPLPPGIYTGTLVTNLGEPYPDTPLYFTSDFGTLETQTDPAGNFFVDLPLPGIYNITMDGTGLSILTLVPEGSRTILTSAAGDKKVANKPPIAEAGPDQMVLPGTVVVLNASESSDVDGPIVDYTWNFDDGTPNGQGIAVNHTYTTPGDYNVTLTVTDEAGANGTETVMIYVREASIIEVGHDVATTNATPSKTIVGQGLPIGINVTVENQGDFAESFNVTAYANTTQIGKLTANNLANGTSTTIAFTWNTTGFAKGNYTISVVADIVPGETDTTDNNFTDGWVIVAMVGDISGPDGWPDGKVNIMDLTAMAKIFGVSYPDPRYNANYDLNDDLKINIADLTKAAKHFGETDP